MPVQLWAWPLVRFQCQIHCVSIRATDSSALNGVICLLQNQYLLRQVRKTQHCWNKDVTAVLCNQTESLHDCLTYCCCCYLTIIYAGTADCGTLLYETSFSHNIDTWPSMTDHFMNDLTDLIQVPSTFQQTLPGSSAFTPASKTFLVVKADASTSKQLVIDTCGPGSDT